MCVCVCVRSKEWETKASQGKKRAKGDSEKRLSKFRSKRSKSFLKSLEIAKAKKQLYQLTKVEQVNAVKEVLSVKFYQDTLSITITNLPSCSCKFFNKQGQGTKRESCAHIIWVMLNYYEVDETSSILNQVAFLSNELKEMFGKPNISKIRQSSSSCSSGASCSSSLTPAEERAIFEAKSGKSSNKDDPWFIQKLTERKHVVCRTCKATMPSGKILVRTAGFYIPPGQRFAVEANFYFCASFECFRPVNHSSIVVVPTSETLFTVEESSTLTEEDCGVLTQRGFKIR